MKKVFFIIVLTILFNKASYAEYYFKECKIDAEYLANYIINFEQEIIKVRFIKKDGYSQEWKDKIETVAKNRVTSKIIQSKKNKEYFTQYYLICRVSIFAFQIFVKLTRTVSTFDLAITKHIGGRYNILIENI